MQRSPPINLWSESRGFCRKSRVLQKVEGIFAETLSGGTVFAEIERRPLLVTCDPRGGASTRVGRHDINDVRSCTVHERSSHAEHVCTDEKRGKAACAHPKEVPQAMRAVRRPAAGDRTRTQERRGTPRLVGSQVPQALYQKDARLRCVTAVHPTAICARGA